MTSDVLAELPEFLQPKLRLFMSVDITGSTQFKQLLSHPHRKSASTTKDDGEDGIPAEPWLSPILEFYEQISTIFGEQWKAVAKHVADEADDCDMGDRPTVWKAVGDELIFSKVLTDHRQAYMSVLAWLRTVQDYRVRIKEHSGSLDLKCAAWIAGFPINNAEVILDHQSPAGLTGPDDGDYILGNLSRLHEYSQRAQGDGASGKGGIRDFIGPSMDTGFRVASVASTRRFVLSADLAFMLAHAAGNLPSTWPAEHLQFYYEGRKDLKGVTNGTPYPVFWVNAVQPDALMEIEDKIEKRVPTEHSQVKTFCERFLEKNKDTHVMKPFIFKDSDSLFKKVPTRHLEKLQKLSNYWTREQARRDAEAAAQLDPEISTENTTPSPSGADLDELTSKLVTPPPASSTPPA